MPTFESPDVATIGAFVGNQFPKKDRKKMAQNIQYICDNCKTSQSATQMPVNWTKFEFKYGGDCYKAKQFHFCGKCWDSQPPGVGTALLRKDRENHTGIIKRLILNLGLSL